MKSFVAKETDIDRAWLVVDAADKPLGRLAAKIADALRGKDKPTFTPHVDTGCFVIVVNAEKVKLTGGKDDKKVYRRYTGYRGGLKEETAADVRQRRPEFLVEHAVKGMLPKNNLSRQMISRLKIYAGAEHPHAAQQPQPVEWV